MKQIFKPVSLILFAVSVWITWVCASLLHFDDSGNLIAGSYSVWGDWSVHFTFINALRERGFHWLVGDNPLFPGIPFQYPFLSHVITYVFSVITFTSTITATYYLSLMLMLVLPFTLYQVLRKLKLSAWGSLSAVLAFLLIGGFQWMDSSLNPHEPLTNQFDHASVFTQFILFEFFPQRAFLFGLLTFLACALYTFHVAFHVKEWTFKKKLGLGFILALTSLLHLHTWISLSTLLLFLFLLPPIAKKGVRKDILFFGVGVAALSSLFLSFLLLRNHASESRLAWDIGWPGWAQNPKANIPRAQDMNFFTFWIFNTGIYLPLAALGMWCKRKEKILYAIAASGIFIFIIAEFFNIQPYYYDNLKLFTYAFLFFAPFVGFGLEAIAGFSKFPKYAGVALASALLIVQISAASIDLYSFQTGLQRTLFFSANEFALADQFKSLRSSPDAIVLINPRHNHWVPCLTGNPVSMGYPGWMWSWGISYGEREKLVHSVLFGEADADSIIEKLHIAYAAIEQNEKLNNRPVNRPYFETHFKKIMDAYGWSVYSLNDRLISPSTSVR